MSMKKIIFSKSKPFAFYYYMLEFISKKIDIKTYIIKTAIKYDKNVRDKYNQICNNLDRYLEQEAEYNFNNGMSEDVVKAIKSRHKKEWTKYLNSLKIDIK